MDDFNTMSDDAFDFDAAQTDGAFSEDLAFDLDAIEQTISDDSLFAGRYKIIQKLRNSETGPSFLAEDQKLENNLVTLKILPAFLVSNQKALDAIKAEALIAMQLAHSNIIPCRDYDQTENFAYLVYDYLDGQSLAEYLIVNGALSDDEAYKLFTQIADAVDYSHSLDITHGDINPSNIYIDNSGKGFLGDFAIACELKKTMTTMTGTFAAASQT
ncbi:MAG: protein kinase [Lentisphaeria bacterium]|nr:protein kinase [Lentisphaeria bacterium]NQZ70441.1 protein kinase [Lentisphaeria bacterium]